MIQIQISFNQIGRFFQKQIQVAIFASLNKPQMTVFKRQFRSFRQATKAGNADFLGCFLQKNTVTRPADCIENNAADGKVRIEVVEAMKNRADTAGLSPGINNKDNRYI